MDGVPDSSPKQSAPKDVGLLQLRYSELLEQRIAQLESIIKTSSSSATPSSDVKASESAPQKYVAGEHPSENPVPETAKSEEAPPDESQPKKRKRFRNVVRRFNKEKGIHEDTEIEGLEKKTDDSKVAFTFRTNAPVEGEKTGEELKSEIDVETSGLRSILKDCIGDDYPGQNLDGDPVNIISPYAALVHNWDKLRKATEACDGDNEEKKQAREDLQTLMACVETAPDLEKYFKTRESNLRANITTYEFMWTCFAPGTKIIAKLFLDELQVLQVSRSPIPRSIPRETKLPILAWCWDWDGSKLVKVYFWIYINQFWGTKSISDLLSDAGGCYPLDAHTEKDELCKQLRARGTRYDEIVRSKPGAKQMRGYEGDALAERRSVIRKPTEDNDDDSDDENAKFNANSRRRTARVDGTFIVDHGAFLRYGGTRSHVLGEKEAVWTGELDPTSATSTGPRDLDVRPSPDELLLYPPRFLGYSTEEKFWGQFAVKATLPAPKKDSSLFERVELDKSYKKMIKALVEQHGSENHEDGEQVEVRDLVDNKGKGLVLLLHGPPGVGKTLTAETIAKATGKPLFVVSVAEIGLDASKAERNLDQMFDLAGKWEAVLLVDEADVFLEARTSNSDPNRNALVSVLLRVLEYYEGIMILTTNRITSLDIAVQSRIHLAIRYDDLDQEQRNNVFDMFLKQLRPDSISDFKTIQAYVKDWNEDNKLNGRQIRNVISAALSLARSRAKSDGGHAAMTREDLKTVLRITKDFEKQLESRTMDARRENEVKRGN